jgi:chorismate lyase/3-hydroxybenzoate synthase
MIPTTSMVPTALPALQIVLGPETGATCDAGVPVLAGETVEQLFTGAQPAGRAESIALHRTDDWLVGAATMTLRAGLETTAHQLYANIFQATRGLHLARIWNYVPAINESGPDGLENYRVFCRARSLAFEQHHGPGFESILPSASAVGTKSDRLTIVFATSARPPRHVENPLQISAYDYPGEYGPRAPCFARATVVPGTDRGTVFISGTAAIRGHATIAPEKLLPQVECTLENLREISAACGLGADLARGSAATRHFKVYLRHAADQPEVAAKLKETLLTDSDRVSYLHADICRAELLVEIEATLRGVPGVL